MASGGGTLAQMAGVLTQTRVRESGFSLNEVMVVAAITMLTVGVAAPTITSAVRTGAIDGAAQTLAMTVRNARYQAVTRNVTLRVRFNCPAANQLRVVEVTGNAGIDSASDRCSLDTYPYPDASPGVAPNNDGPVVTMPRDMALGLTQDFTINTSGRVNAVSGALPVRLEVGDAHALRSISITGGGQVSVSSGMYARAD